jgi:hypothetical protein
MTVRLDVDAYSLAARLRERLDHEMLAEVADLLRRTEEVQTSRYYRTGTCEAMVPGEPLPIADEAALGTDERWHPLHPDTAVMLCDHTTWYPKERPAPTLVTPRTTRPVLSTPRPDRCAPHPISGVREELPAVHWPGFAEANRPTPGLWPTRRPPKWYIWLTLYPLQGRRCAACRRRPPQVIDHCHDTALVRGLLCSACNTNAATAHQNHQ